MTSALEHVDVVEKYPGEEREAGRILVPFGHEVIPDLHVNRFGVIPRGVHRGSGGSSLISPSRKTPA